MITPRRAATAILFAGIAVMLAWNAPGQMSWDSIVQLANGRDGFYDSWHPPVMAWLLGRFDSVWPGSLLFLVFQALLWLGALLGFLWLWPRGWWSVIVALAVVLTPQTLLFQGEIWKDVLFANAAIAGFAALAWQARKPRFYWPILSALLLALAAATRQNALVLLPVAAVTLALIARRQAQRGWLYGLGFLAVTAGLVAGADLALAAHGDGGQGASDELRLGQSYDMVGVLAGDPAITLPALKTGDPKLEALLRNPGAALYSPLHNDPFGDNQAIGDAISTAPRGVIAHAWRQMIVAHPLDYLRTRLAIFADVLLTPESFACHFSPVGIAGPPELLRHLGITARIRPQDQALADYARAFFATPVYAHLFWAALALAMLLILLRRGHGPDLAVAGLLAGALIFTLTFVIVSIACDYRYLVFLDLSAMAAAIYLAAGKPDPT